MARSQGSLREWEETEEQGSMGVKWVRTEKQGMEWNTHQSRSISPNLNPPSFDLPSVGCLVKFALGPVGRACILSITMCCLLAELVERSETSEARQGKEEWSKTSKE
jgi:hypothetical protein